MKNFREKWKLLKIPLTQHQPGFFIKLVTKSLDFINSCHGNVNVHVQVTTTSKCFQINFRRSC